MTIAAAFPFLFLSSVVEGNSMDVHPHIQDPVSLKAEGGDEELEPLLPTSNSSDQKYSHLIRWICREWQCKQDIDGLMAFLSCMPRYRQVLVEALVRDVAAKPQSNPISAEQYRQAVVDHYPEKYSLLQSLICNQPSPLTVEEKARLHAVEVEGVTYPPTITIGRLHGFIVPDEFLEPARGFFKGDDFIAKTEYASQRYDGETLREQIASMMRHNPKGIRRYPGDKTEIGDLLGVLVTKIEETRPLTNVPDVGLLADPSKA